MKNTPDESYVLGLVAKTTSRASSTKLSSTISGMRGSHVTSNSSVASYGSFPKICKKYPSTANLDDSTRS